MKKRSFIKHPRWEFSNTYDLLSEVSAERVYKQALESDEDLMNFWTRISKNG